MRRRPHHVLTDAGVEAVLADVAFDVVVDVVVVELCVEGGLQVEADAIVVDVVVA